MIRDGGKDQSRASRDCRFVRETVWRILPSSYAEGGVYDNRAVHEEKELGSCFFAECVLLSRAHGNIRYISLKNVKTELFAVTKK